MIHMFQMMMVMMTLMMMMVMAMIVIFSNMEVRGNDYGNDLDYNDQINC